MKLIENHLQLQLVKILAIIILLSRVAEAVWLVWHLPYHFFCSYAMPYHFTGMHSSHTQPPGSPSNKLFGNYGIVLCVAFFFA